MRLIFVKGINIFIPIYWILGKKNRFTIYKYIRYRYELEFFKENGKNKEKARGGGWAYIPWAEGNVQTAVDCVMR